jgi:putative hydrolase of the HAD superfamily
VQGIARLQRAREEQEREFPPQQIWSDYVFPDRGLPAARLADAAEDLTLFYELNFYARSLRPEAPAVLAELKRRGYRLALISNVMSLNQVPICLEKYGIAGYFDVVLTSSAFGCRKPNERIFLAAAAQLGLDPAVCAYVGDTVSRDVAGARRAGYGMAIQIRSFLTARADTEGDNIQPDAIIEDLTSVTDLVGDRRVS